MHASNPNSSVTSGHLAGPPAMPMTWQPLILAICPATLPTAPAAPDTTTVSPSLSRPVSSRPK